MIYFDKSNLLDLFICKSSDGYFIKYSRLIKSQRYSIEKEVANEVELFRAMYDFNHLSDEAIIMIDRLRSEIAKEI